MPKIEPDTELFRAVTRRQRLMIDLSTHLKPDSFEAIGHPCPLTVCETFRFAEKLKGVPDSPETFPRGKWATIHAIQAVAEERTDHHG